MSQKRKASGEPVNSQGTVFTVVVGVTPQCVDVNRWAIAEALTRCREAEERLAVVMSEGGWV